jgi:hypothetical protein
MAKKATETGNKTPDGLNLISLFWICPIFFLLSVFFSFRVKLKTFQSGNKGSFWQRRLDCFQFKRWSGLVVVAVQWLNNKVEIYLKRERINWLVMQSPKDQGCQIVYFQTQNPSLGKIRRALERKMF